MTLLHTAPLIVPRSALRLTRHLVGTARRWPVESQQVARRNAMIAGTEMTALRRERDEVDELLAALTAPEPAGAVRRTGG